MTPRRSGSTAAAAAAGIVAAAWAVGLVGIVRGAEGPAVTFREFLASKGIDAASRESLAAEGPWSGPAEAVLVRVLARLPAPDPLAAAWRREAEPLAAHGPLVDDRLVVVDGRAVFVAPLRLSKESAMLAGRATYDVVRLVDREGRAVDAVVPQAPRAWRRWESIDEPATVFGLPLATAAGPEPSGDDPGHRWPAPPPALVVAAPAVEWHPSAPLGRLGVDFALFDAVVDDRGLEAPDGPAFWATLAAVRGASPGEIARAAGGVTEIVPLIDPQQGWFAAHRGDPVLIDGVARRATRIAIDDPGRRAQVAADHYWELEVFVDTPPISIDGRVQDRYPVVCCVRELAAGMPVGEAISERVRVPGFAFKRYRYPLPEVVVDGERTFPAGRRRAVPLVVAPRAEPLVPTPPRGLSAGLFWLFSGLLAIVATLLAASSWSLARDARRTARQRREALPERIDLPSE